MCTTVIMLMEELFIHNQTFIHSNSKKKSVKEYGIVY